MFVMHPYNVPRPTLSKLQSGKLIILCMMHDLFLTCLSRNNSVAIDKRKQLSERQVGVTGFGFHSIQHVLISKALLTILYLYINVQYHVMHSHRHTH